MDRYDILLVEDDAIVAIDTRHRVEKLGHAVVGVVPDGEAAVAFVRARVPTLVLMDIGLPGMDGVEAAAKVREVVDVPVVFLTAHEDDATLARAKVTEPYGYLLKPSTDREIQITIELAVYRHAMERERARLQAQIKHLEGIVPICSHCKKMRDAAGYWQRVEAYLSARTDAHFSHGICPDCMPILYPPAEHPYLYEDDAPEADGKRRP